MIFEKEKKLINKERSFIQEVRIISDEAIEYINKNAKKIKVSEKYKNTTLF